MAFFDLLSASVRRLNEIFDRRRAQHRGKDLSALMAISVRKFNTGMSKQNFSHENPVKLFIQLFLL